MNSSTAIDINDLHFTWLGENTPLLNIPHWQVNEGERVFLYGRSGTGKSTLLNILSGILPAQQGRVSLFGDDITRYSASQRDNYRAKNMGIIFQQFNLIPYLTVVENVRLSQYFSQTPLSLERMTMLLEQLGLQESLLNQKASQLSVGQQQRVAVARALYHKPRLIIADEPTSALDTETRDNFISLLLEQSKKSNSTVLFVSHDKQLAHHFDSTIDLTQLNKGGAYHAI